MARKLQFSASYLVAEDRLLLRGAFPDDTEIGLLLTRRMTRGLLDGLDKLATKMVAAEVGVTPDQKQQVASFTREAAVGQADFSQDFAEGKPHPLMAEGPRLVTQASFTPKAGERIDVGFTLDKGERVKFTLPAKALWSLGHLLSQQAERAEWKLRVEARWQPAESAASAPGKLN